MDVLFIGNGLNRVSTTTGSHAGDYSWAAVLTDLLPHAKVPDDFSAGLSAKPFTLAFEEICFLAAEHAATGDPETGSVNDLELALKRSVAENIARIPTNDLHTQAMAVTAAAAATAPQHIITTNYDYNLETASGLDFGPSETDETKYSLRRRRTATTADGGEVTVWHIHGEADAPRTLMLSHDHYVRYINRMRRYVPADDGMLLGGDTGSNGAAAGNGTAAEMLGGDTGSNGATAELLGEDTGSNGATAELLGEDTGSNGEQDAGSHDAMGRPVWVGLFLQSDVHVLGFGFDYTEIELWWLLSLKRREALRGRRVGTTTYYPVVAPDSDYTKVREGILASYGVRIDESCRRDTYAAGYGAFLARER